MLARISADLLVPFLVHLRFLAIDVLLEPVIANRALNFIIDPKKDKIYGVLRIIGLYAANFAPDWLFAIGPERTENSQSRADFEWNPVEDPEASFADRFQLCWPKDGRIEIRDKLGHGKSRRGP